MITEQTLINFIESLGHKPASPSICVNNINKSPLNTELQFYVNPHNLCWLATEQFLRNNYENKTVGKLISTNVRDIKLTLLL